MKEIADEIFTKHGITLPLEAQGTTTDADRLRYAGLQDEEDADNGSYRHSRKSSE